MHVYDYRNARMLANDTEVVLASEYLDKIRLEVGYNIQILL